MFMNTELARLEPRAFMRRFLPDFDRFFDDEWRVARLGKPFADVEWVPPVEAFERDHCLTVRVELPGMKKEEIGVTVTGEGLLIEGERKLENEEKKNEWYRTERTYGRFARLVPLPDGVKAAEIKATFEGGVLEIAAPLSATPAVETPKKIEIGGAEGKKTVKGA